MELFDLSGRSAIVTGSTRGIGRATATRLVEHGAQVVVCGRSEESAGRVAEEINAKVGARRAIGAAFDLAGAPEPLVQRAADAFGRLDILFLSSPAGAYTTGHVLVVDGGAMLAGTQALRDSLAMV